MLTIDSSLGGQAVVPHFEFMHLMKHSRIYATEEEIIKRICIYVFLSPYVAEFIFAYSV